jgi:CubicO group peptidase (beta-lactamase class C family)
VLHVVQKDESYTRHFGKADSDDAMFLLGSISKPINVTAVMTLFDQGKFQLDDSVKKFLPDFKGDGRDDVTIRHLLTHVSGLPDQLANNNELRKEHAPLTEFAKHALRAQLDFAPGTKYQYSSMGILLATRIAEQLSGSDILTLVERTVFRPLGMKHSAQGLGKFKLEEMVVCQMDGAAPESGGGDPMAKEWDWNSPYWRKLGAPWGGTHASAPDLARFLGSSASLMNWKQEIVVAAWAAAFLSAGVQHARPQQRQTRATIHLPLDRLQPIHVSFHGAITPRFLERRRHRRLVPPQTLSETP